MHCGFRYFTHKNLHSSKYTLLISDMKGERSNVQWSSIGCPDEFIVRWGKGVGSYKHCLYNMVIGNRRGHEQNYTIYTLCRNIRLTKCNCAPIDDGIIKFYRGSSLPPLSL